MARQGQRGEGSEREPRQTTAGTEREATDVEREGMDLLGRSSVRDDAIAGASDASARSDQRAEATGSAGAGKGPRRNPPENPSAGMGEGGIDQSGGIAGGARGHGGRSDAMQSLDGGDQPGELKGTSRQDYDHGSVDRPGGGGFTDEDERRPR